MQSTQANHSKIKRFEVFPDEKALQKFLEDGFSESLKQFIKLTIKSVVKSEMDEFRKGLEDKPYFNGYYQRDMLSNYGKISDIPIPRFRSIL
ncbi:MAG: hypothetical protein BWY74_02495 [Firmicutes bacterium ADurb.Bin419]|nr:MAG: hypothetical protein BWY74_02495 [Firmicutes bacterium ADurb.Bin419]